jgi:hypothetical protein
MGKIPGLLLETQKGHELYGVYAFAVSNHIFSQKTMLNYSFKDFGAEMNLPAAELRGIRGMGNMIISFSPCHLPQGARECGIISVIIP